MTDIAWETPPPAPRPGRRPSEEQANFAAALRSRPETWARLSRSFSTRAAAHTAAANIRWGRLAAYRPERSFEAEMRVIEGVPTVYVRYVGGAE